jgi:parvulin-like peptidyl-prolyl isomerase
MAEEHFEQENFYVCVKAPKTLRRSILESSKDTLFILKQVYTIRQIRDAKHQVMAEVDDELKELKILIQKIDDLMPKYNKDELKKLIPDVSSKRKQFLKKEKAEAKVKEEHRAKQEPASEVDKLTMALDAIQKKLQNL